MDFLTLLPLKDGKPEWIIDENHMYDILMVADAVGKVWSIPYYVAGYSHEFAETIHGTHNFHIFINWITTGKRPANANDEVMKHYDYYVRFVSMGLAEKCLYSPEYRKAMYDALMDRLSSADAKKKIPAAALLTTKKEVEKLFGRLSSIKSNEQDLNGVKETVQKIGLLIFAPLKPFEFVGIYHWDGMDLKFERTDFIPGKSLVPNFKIPASASLIDDEELAKHDFVSYNLIFTGDDDDDEDWDEDDDEWDEE